MSIFIVLISIYVFLFIFIINYPEFIIPFIVLLSPLERFNINIGFSLTPIIAFFPICLLSIFVNYHKIRWNDIGVNFYLYLSLVFVLLSIFVSCLFSINKFISFKSLFYIILSILYFYISYISVIYFCKFRTVIYSIFLMLLMISSYGFFQYIIFLIHGFAGFKVITILHSTSISPNAFTVILFGIRFLRPASTFSDVNTASGFVGFFIPILLMFIIFSKYFIKIFNKYIITAFIIISILTMVYFVLTFSKASLLAVTCGFVFLFFYYRLYKHKFILFLLVTILLGIVFILSKILFSHRIGFFLAAQEYSFRIHFILSLYALKIFIKHPIFGSGLSTFTYYFGLYIKPLINYPLNNIDNPPLFLLWLSELGIIGFISYISFIIIYFKILLLNLSTKYQSIPLLRHISVGFIAGIISLMISNLFHSYFTLIFIWVFLGIILGIFRFKVLK